MGARRLVGCAAAVALIVVVPPVDATPAAAAPAWSVVSSPSPPGPQYAELNAITCPTTSTCVAVGNTPVAPNSFFPVIPSPRSQVWNGSSWSAVPVSSPAAALGDVACPSPSSCFAVGGPLSGPIWHWNGTAWSVADGPHPSGTTIALSGVSCPSPTRCIAVGIVLGSTAEGAIAMWDGTSWSNETIPGTGSFYDVSCTSASFCVAVGNTSIAHWNGTTWTLVSSHPAGDTLRGVSCTSSSFCVAVGSTAIKHWNGTNWSNVAEPPGAANQEWRGVSCASSSFCVAAGSSRANASKTLPRTAHWNGTSWSLVPSPNPPQYGAAYYDGELAGVECTDASTCVAVGVSRGNAALVERWNGTAWSLDPPPVNYSQSRLAHVSCPSATTCITVGSFLDGNESNAMAVRSTGAALATWSSDAMPEVAGDDQLAGVTCRSASNCVAVGSAGTTAARTRTLVERWNGAHWSIVPSPNRKIANKVVANDLNAVSCPTPTSCFAVGRAGPTTLIQHRNGSAWSIVASPSLGTSSELSDVSCASAQFCIAVGQTFGKQGRSAALIQRWNGTKWTIVASPKRKSGTNGRLSAVSCTSATACTAVGSDIGPSEWNRTMVQRWNGTKWTIVPSPNPKYGALGASLEDVSCPAANSCTAVGSRTVLLEIHSLATYHFVERWNGTKWTIVPSPKPAGATDTALSGVRCVTSNRCVAVGAYQGTFGGRTLVERYG